MRGKSLDFPLRIYIQDATSRWKALVEESIFIRLAFSVITLLASSLGLKFATSSLRMLQIEPISTPNQRMFIDNL